MILRLISILRENDCLHFLPAFRAEGVEDGHLGKLTDRHLRLLGVERLGDRMRLLEAFAPRKSAPEKEHSAAGSRSAKLLSEDSRTDPPLAISIQTESGAVPGVQADGEKDRGISLEIRGGCELEFKWCPPGSFVMGSPFSELGRGVDEGPVNVRILNGFWMGRTQVTQEVWGAVMGSSPSHRSGPLRPVENVTWEDAMRFVEGASRLLRIPVGYRMALPTEAQWEYACRAGTTTPFHFGGTLSSAQANYDGNYPYGYSEPGSFLEETADCGSYPPNAWGLCEMHGNVWEWCSDWYSEQLAGGDDPQGPDAGPGRVYRGGSWHSIADHCRSAFRYYLPPGSYHMFLGFRVALVANP